MKNNTLSIVAICLSIGTIAGTIGVHKYAKLNDELVVQASERKIDREIEGLRDTVIKHILLSKKNGQLKPLKLEKRGNLLLNGVGCLAGSVLNCAEAIDDFSNLGND